MGVAGRDVEVLQLLELVKLHEEAEHLKPARGISDEAATEHLWLFKRYAGHLKDARNLYAKGRRAEAIEKLRLAAAFAVDIRRLWLADGGARLN